MCDAAPDGGAQFPPRRPSAAPCSKCKTEPGVVPVRQRMLCVGCATKLQSVRVGKILFKSRDVSSESKVVVAYSGSAASQILLDMMVRNMERPYAKVVPERKAVFVSSASIPGLGVSGDGDGGVAAHLAALEASASARGFALDVVTLGAPMWTPGQVGEMFEGLGRGPSEELRRVLVERTLSEYAVEHAVEVLVRGDTARTVAVDAMMMLVSGRGEQMYSRSKAQSMAFNGAGPYAVYRPFVDSLASDMEIMGAELGIVPVSEPRARSGTAVSLRALTETFIDGLQAEFPATVNAVAKTVAKLAPVDSAALADVHCKLCGDVVGLPTHTDVVHRVAGDATGAAATVTVANFGVVDTTGSELCYACRSLSRRMPPASVADYILS